jgi:hypothetical protein
MWRPLLLLAIPCLLAAEDHWVKFTSGPYEVYTDAGVRAGQETMVKFEEFRNAVGKIIGEQDLETPLPVRMLVFKHASGWTLPSPVSEGRSSYNIVLEEKAEPSPAIYIALTRLFLHSNTAQMPPAFEHGLIEFFSTYQVKGIHITAGVPPPHPDLDWARIHMLVVDPEYFGRLKVVLYNLRKGVDEDAAYQNAFGKPASAIEALVKQHFAAGNFQTGTIDSAAISPKDFPERQVSDADARLIRADLLAGAQSAAEYQSLLKDRLKVPEAEEGLGLLALHDGQTDVARKHFAAAIAAQSSSARCYIEYAKLEPDNAKATEALLHAAGINPKLDEPFALMAARDTDPQKRLAHWKAAAERNPRNPAYWKSLAECYLAEHDYAGAARAWTQGEQAATDPKMRAEMRQSRVAIEQQRLDYQSAEKKRQADEDARELAKLKAQALEHVHELEAAANRGANTDAHGQAAEQKPVPWWNGPKPGGKVSGVLRQVDCLGSRARMVVETEGGKNVRLLVTDPTTVAILGPSSQTLGCGRQLARNVTVEYFPKANARLGTVGEVATIAFQ